MNKITQYILALMLGPPWRSEEAWASDRGRGRRRSPRERYCGVRGRRTGPGLSHPPLPAPAESGFVKERAKQFYNIFKRRPRAYIAFPLYKIV